MQSSLNGIVRRSHYAKSDASTKGSRNQETHFIRLAKKKPTRMSVGQMHMKLNYPLPGSLNIDRFSGGADAGSNMPSLILEVTASIRLSNSPEATAVRIT